MPQNREILFPTFVLSCALLFTSAALGAKTTPSPDFDVPEKTQPTARENPQHPAPDALERDTVDIAKPPPSTDPYGSQREYFYPYRQAITVRAGQALSTVTINNTSTPLLGGIEYEMMTEDRKIYEAGADLMSDGTGSLSLAKRWIYTRSRLRPYTKGGLGLLVRPADGLAALVNFVNFRVEGAVGTEYLVRKAQSVRFELEATISTKILTIDATAGYVWAW